MLGFAPRAALPLFRPSTDPARTIERLYRFSKPLPPTLCQPSSTTLALSSCSSSWSIVFVFAFCVQRVASRRCQGQSVVAHCVHSAVANHHPASWLFTDTVGTVTPFGRTQVSGDLMQAVEAGVRQAEGGSSSSTTVVRADVAEALRNAVCWPRLFVQKVWMLGRDIGFVIKGCHSCPFSFCAVRCRAALPLNVSSLSIDLWLRAALPL